MSKKSPGFFILPKDRLIAGVIGLTIGLAGTQVHPVITQAAAVLPHPSPSPRADVRIDLTGQGKDPAVPAKLSPIATPVAAVTPVSTPVPAAAPAQPVSPAQPELVGTIGYARAGGNCVNEPGVNNPHFGNPISWPVLFTEPHVGATALFTWNHTGVVTGIWSNGDVEVRHQNFWGGNQHRFPRSMFRGFR